MEGGGKSKLNAYDMVAPIDHDHFAGNGPCARAQQEDGRVGNLGELEAQRSRHLRLYGSDSTTIERVLDGSYLIGDGADTFTLPNNDFNILSFRSNVVLRWEWRPGSTLFLVWQQDRSSFETRGDRIGAGNLFGSLSAPGDNFFVVKASFWIPVG